MWSRSTSQVRKTSEAKKVRQSPAMIAWGRRPPPLALPAKTIGSTGYAHGEIAVIAPTRKAVA
jgi:hypothetical protein